MLARLLGAAAAGAVLPLSFAPFDLFPLAPAALAALFYLWHDRRPTEALWLGFAFGFASFLGGTYWTFISVREFGGAPVALSVAATLGLVFVLATFVAIAGWGAARWRPSSLPRSMLMTMPALWVLTEWCRGWIFTGFGWLSAGYSQTDSWLMGYASVIGLHGISYAVAMSGGAIVVLVKGSITARASALSVLVLVWAGGWALDRVTWTTADGAPVSVALVQGSVTQDVKWLPEQFPATLALYRDLTLRAAGQQLVIWPEVAIPSLYESVTEYLDEIRELAGARGGTVMLGILKRDPAANAAQNAFVALTSEPQFYIKRHLVPFGEYFPLPAFAREWLRLLDLPYTDVSRGDDAQPLLQVGGQSIAVTICYEDVFGSEQIDFLPEASLLVNVSNDAWFGDSLAPHQHLQIARVRAAEAGRYLLRSTNTGISAVIDPQGRVQQRAEQFRPEVVLATVRGQAGATPYTIWHNYPVVGLAIVAWLSQLLVTRLMIRPGT